MSSKTTSALAPRSSSSSAAVKIASRFAPELTAANNAPCVCRAMSCSGAKGRGVKSASHAPHSTRAVRCCFENSCSSAVLPIPASPPTSARQPPRSTAAPSHSAKSARHRSRSRSCIDYSGGAIREFSRRIFLISIKGLHAQRMIGRPAAAGYYLHFVRLARGNDTYRGLHGDKDCCLGCAISQGLRLSPSVR